MDQLSVYKEVKWLINFQLESVKCVSTPRIAPTGRTIVELKNYISSTTTFLPNLGSVH